MGFGIEITLLDFKGLGTAMPVKSNKKLSTLSIPCSCMAALYLI